MARERSDEPSPQPLEPPAWLALAAALAFVLLAVLAVVFDLVREAPPEPECGGTPEGHDELLADYRRGSVTWHAVAVLWCLGTLVAISVVRSPRRGLHAVGLPTFLGAGLSAIAFVLALNAEVGLLLAVPALLIGAPGLLAVNPGGDVGVTLLGILLLLAGAAFTWVGVREGHLRLVSAGLWWLAWFAAGHLALVQLAGHGPLFC